MSLFGIEDNIKVLARHDIVEVLLSMALNTNQSINQSIIESLRLEAKKYAFYQVNDFPLKTSEFMKMATTR